jgi:hypothetical protein
MKIRRGCGQRPCRTPVVSRGDTVQVAIPAGLNAIQLSVPARAPRKTIEPDPLASYEQFVAGNPQSETAPVVRGVIDHLARTKGVLDEEMRACIRKTLNNSRTACER